MQGIKRARVYTFRPFHLSYAARTNTALFDAATKEDWGVTQCHFWTLRGQAWMKTTKIVSACMFVYAVAPVVGSGQIVS